VVRRHLIELVCDGLLKNWWLTSPLKIFENTEFGQTTTISLPFTKKIMVNIRCNVKSLSLIIAGEFDEMFESRLKHPQDLNMDLQFMIACNTFPHPFITSSMIFSRASGDIDF